MLEQLCVVDHAAALLDQEQGGQNCAGPPMDPQKLDKWMKANRIANYQVPLERQMRVAAPIISDFAVMHFVETMGLFPTIPGCEWAVAKSSRLSKALLHPYQLLSF